MSIVIGAYMLPITIAIFIIGLVIIYKTKIISKSLFISMIICLVLGNFRTTIFKEEYRVYDNYVIGEHICLTGEVSNIVQYEFSYAFKIKNGSIYYYVYTDDIGDVVIGNTVIVEGVVKKSNTARNPGNFDETKYLHSLGIVGKLDAKKIDIIDKRCNEITLGLQNIRNELASKIDSITDEEYGSILKAMIFGEKSDLDEETKSLYQTAGISHVLAISGLHISAVGLVLFSLLRKKFSYYSSSVISGTFMVLFGVMTGGSVSTIRALIMFVISLVSKVAGRKYDLKSSLALTVLLMLLDNPYYLFNSSFQLSVMAIISIAFVFPILNEFLTSKIRCENKTFMKFMSSFLLSFTISILSAPIVAYTYFELSVYSIFINLIVIPLMSFLLCMGIFSIVLSFVSTSIGVFLIGTDVTILKLYNFICDSVSKLPGNTINVKKPEICEIVIYYLIVVFVLIVMKHHSNDKFKERLKVLVVIIGFVFLFLIIGQKNNKYIITAIDVGQGDCCFVTTENSRVLIDGGSSDIKNVAEYRIVPTIKSYGYDSIDLVIVSHTDNDHISGIREMVEQKLLEIKHIALPYTAAEDENASEFVAILDEYDINYSFVKEGDCIKIDDSYFYVLNPKKNQYGDINEDSLVVYYKSNDISALFLGDISSNVEQDIIEKYAEYIEMVDIVKIAHHGSKNSSCQEFTRYIANKTAIISCGVNNSYGHPHDETLSRLEAVGCNICITSECGAIMVEGGNNKEVCGFLEE